MGYEIEDLRSRYERLDAVGKVQCLLDIAFNLTIEYRGLQDSPPDQGFKKHIAINELQHKLLSQTISELSEIERYPDNVFIAILGEIATAGNIQNELVAALYRAINARGAGELAAQG